VCQVEDALHGLGALGVLGGRCGGQVGGVGAASSKEAKVKAGHVTIRPRWVLNTEGVFTLNTEYAEHMTAYQEIATAIRADIEARHLVEGDRLPTVREMAERYGVPTGTVAKAVDMLRADGVIVAKHGRGLYVRAFSRIVRSSPGRLSRSWWTDGKAIQDHDTNGRLRVVDVTVNEVPAPEDVAQAFAVPPGAAVLSRARRFAVEDRIVQFATSLIPLAVVAAAPAVAYTGPGPGGIYARMAEAGIGPQTFRETVVCRMPAPAEAARLTLPGGTPVIAITRHAYTGAGQCVEVNEMVLDSSAYALEYAFTA
jgi:GntR family transcriptional regulator